MKNKIKVLGLTLGSAVASAMPLLASAQVQYQSQLATTTALVEDIGYDVLLTIVAVVGVVSGIIVFVWGVGYGFKKLGSKTGMKKF